MPENLSDIFEDLLKVRYAVPQLTIKEYVDRRGVSIFKDLLRKLGWILIGESLEADWKSIDLTYKLGYALVHIQVKSANLVTEFEKDPTRTSYRRWHWEIFRKKKGLRVEFYKEKNCFLGLVGLDVHEEIYTETKLRISKEEVGYFIEEKEQKIGLIPGSRVIRHFKEKAKKSNKISLKENSVSQWTKYFSYENIKQLLFQEFERQMKDACAQAEN